MDNQLSHSAPHWERSKVIELEKQKIHRMLPTDFIEPDQPELATPIFCILKKNRTPRFSLEHYKLNGVTIQESYPTPRMDEYIECPGYAAILPKLDGNGGYWHVEMAKKDQDKTTFPPSNCVLQFTLTGIWTWRNANVLQTSLIALVISFAFATRIFDTNDWCHTLTPTSDYFDVDSITFGLTQFLLPLRAQFRLSGRLN